MDERPRILAYLFHREWCGALLGLPCDCGYAEELEDLGFTEDDVARAKADLDEQEGIT